MHSVDYASDLDSGKNVPGKPALERNKPGRWAGFAMLLLSLCKWVATLMPAFLPTESQMVIFSF